MTHIRSIKLCSNWSSPAAHASPHRGRLGCLGVLRVKATGRLVSPSLGNVVVNCGTALRLLRHLHLHLHMLFAWTATAASGRMNGIRRSPDGARYDDMWKSPLYLQRISVIMAAIGSLKRIRRRAACCKCDFVKSVGAAPKRQQFGNKVDLTATQFAEPRLIALMIFDSSSGDLRPSALSALLPHLHAAVTQIVPPCVTHLSMQCWLHKCNGGAVYRTQQPGATMRLTESAYGAIPLSTSCARSSSQRIHNTRQKRLSTPTTRTRKRDSIFQARTCGLLALLSQLLGAISVKRVMLHKTTTSSFDKDYTMISQHLKSNCASSHSPDLSCSTWFPQRPDLMFQGPQI
jgi:hypothetical protein